MTKSIAVNVTTYAENPRGIQIETILDRIVKIDEDLISVGVKRTGRGYAITAGPHENTWSPESDSETGNQISIEIMLNAKKWGDLEVAFVPLHLSTPWE